MNHSRIEVVEQVQSIMREYDVVAIYRIDKSSHPDEEMFATQGCEEVWVLAVLHDEESEPEEYRADSLLKAFQELSVKAGG